MGSVFADSTIFIFMDYSKIVDAFITVMQGDIKSDLVTAFMAVLSLFLICMVIVFIGRLILRSFVGGTDDN